MTKPKFSDSFQYYGNDGATSYCLDALTALLQMQSPPVQYALILSYNNRHAFRLTVWKSEYIFIKAGFTSGYSGTGPHGLSSAISLLSKHNIEIDEIDVDNLLFDRLNNNNLTDSDLKVIDKADKVRPPRIWNYVIDQHRHKEQKNSIWSKQQPILPYSIIDPRLIDYAINFESDPHGMIMKGFGRLEELVREISKIDEWGGTLFAKAIKKAQSTNNPNLGICNLKVGEAQGVINLFAGTYSAHRNPVAHSSHEKLSLNKATYSEFLALNHLFVLVEKLLVAKEKNELPDF